MSFSTLSFWAVMAIGCKKPVAEPPPPPPPPVVKEAPKVLPKEVIRMAANFQRAFFELDSALLNQEAKSALDENVEIMQKNPGLRLEIQGHADERGTTDYNLSLGQKRAQAVSRFITGHGIDTSRLKVISYGEERPLEGGLSEHAWSQNRRCEFVIIWTDNPDVKGTL